MAGIMKNLRLEMFLCIVVGFLFLVAIPAQVKAETQLPWDRKAIVKLAKQLYFQTYRTASLAIGEYDGGAPGQEELARMNGDSQTFLLWLERASTTAERSFKWLRLIEVDVYRATITMRTCHPGYSQRVWSGFRKSLALLDQIELYYPEHQHP
jgi:hypothetical protein